MLNNAQIVDKIRCFAKKQSITSDSEICRQCGFIGRGQIRNILNTKTKPQLDTMDKFARGLGVRIEDLIYDRTDADMEMARIWENLTEYEKTETIVWVKVQQREKNKQKQSAVA